ncbi:hypothetical protein ACWCQZ_46270 [Streptomyces sp. NPDC002285]
MSETTGLTSQYSAQVASDLDRNLNEQHRLSAEIDALQAQLADLRHDRTVLVNIQQALGSRAAPAAPAAEPVATVPSFPKKATDTLDAATQPETKKPADKSRTAKAPASSASRTLVDLVRQHLASQSHALSAAEVTTALSQQHPERVFKSTVVRMTLEGLVAKNHVHRIKQGASVFYTAPALPEQASAPQAEEQSKHVEA